ncbi:MAG TPA: HAD family hydrolase [Methylomirabilota bacterium]|nr:HAD family hydrolase [Methylomirabilota bacterium]
MRALLLDLDDTLLDYSGGADACWEAACAEVQPPVEAAALLRALGETRRWFWSDPVRHRRERVDMPNAWRQIAAHALARCGVDGAAPAHALAEAYAARSRATMRLFPDTLDCLRRLRADGLPLGLVTNGDAREQRDKLARYGLGAFFDVVVIEGERGAGKPDEVVYREALAVLGARADEAAMAGDHLEFDVAAPQRLGLRGIWVDRAGRGVPADSPVRPDRVIRGLGELLP